MCDVLPIAPSAYHEHSRRRAQPELRPARARRDDEFKFLIKRIYDENHQVYGVRKVWHQLKRKGVEVAASIVRSSSSATGTTRIERLTASL